MQKLHYFVKRCFSSLNSSQAQTHLFLMSNNVIAIFNNNNNNNTKCVVLAPLACHISGMDFNLFTMHMTYKHRINSRKYHIRNFQSIINNINSHCVVHFLKFHMIKYENMKKTKLIHDVRSRKGYKIYKKNSGLNSKLLTEIKLNHYQIINRRSRQARKSKSMTGPIQGRPLLV